MAAELRGRLLLVTWHNGGVHVSEARVGRAQVATKASPHASKRRPCSPRAAGLWSEPLLLRAYQVSQSQDAEAPEFWETRPIATAQADSEDVQCASLARAQSLLVVVLLLVLLRSRKRPEDEDEAVEQQCADPSHDVQQVSRAPELVVLGQRGLPHERLERLVPGCDSARQANSGGQPAGTSLGARSSLGQGPLARRAGPSHRWQAWQPGRR